MAATDDCAVQLVVSTSERGQANNAEIISSVLPFFFHIAAHGCHPTQRTRCALKGQHEFIKLQP